MSKEAKNGKNVTCVGIVLDWIEILEWLKAFAGLQFLLLSIAQQLCQLFVQSPQRMDLPEAPLNVDCLLRGVGSTLPQVGAVVLPEERGQLLTDVDPFLTQVDALSQRLFHLDRERQVRRSE